MLVLPFSKNSLVRKNLILQIKNPRKGKKREHLLNTFVWVMSKAQRLNYFEEISLRKRSLLWCNLDGWSTWTKLMRLDRPPSKIRSKLYSNRLLIDFFDPNLGHQSIVLMISIQIRSFISKYRSIYIKNIKKFDQKR